MDPNEISVCEKMIMKVIWDADTDLDLMTVTARVNEEFGKTWKIQTVATFLTRLQKKKFIDIYRVGRYSHYHPIVEKNDFKMSTVTEDIKYFDKGSISAFVCGLFDGVKLTEKDKEIIRKKIDELDQCSKSDIFLCTCYQCNWQRDACDMVFLQLILTKMESGPGLLYASLGNNYVFATDYLCGDYAEL